jgi:hypothetical protein
VWNEGKGKQEGSRMRPVRVLRDGIRNSQHNNIAALLLYIKYNASNYAMLHIQPPMTNSPLPKKALIRRGEMEWSWG